MRGDFWFDLGSLVVVVMVLVGCGRRRLENAPGLGEDSTMR